MLLMTFLWSTRVLLFAASIKKSPITPKLSSSIVFRQMQHFGRSHSNPLLVTSPGCSDMGSFRIDSPSYFRLPPHNPSSGATSEEDGSEFMRNPSIYGLYELLREKMNEAAAHGLDPKLVIEGMHEVIEGMVQNKPIVDGIQNAPIHVISAVIQFQSEFHSGLSRATALAVRELESKLKMVFKSITGKEWTTPRTPHSTNTGKSRNSMNTMNKIDSRGRTWSMETEDLESNEIHVISDMDMNQSNDPNNVQNNVQSPKIGTVIIVVAYHHSLPQVADLFRKGKFERVAKMFIEMFPPEYRSRFIFTDEYGPVLILRDIPGSTLNQSDPATDPLLTTSSDSIHNYYVAGFSPERNSPNKSPPRVISLNNSIFGSSINNILQRDPRQSTPRQSRPSKRNGMTSSRTPQSARSLSSRSRVSANFTSPHSKPPLFPVTPRTPTEPIPGSTRVSRSRFISNLETPEYREYPRSPRRQNVVHINPEAQHINRSPVDISGGTSPSRNGNDPNVPNHVTAPPGSKSTNTTIEPLGSGNTAPPFKHEHLRNMLYILVAMCGILCTSTMALVIVLVYCRRSKVFNPFKRFNSKISSPNDAGLELSVGRISRDGPANGTNGTMGTMTGFGGPTTITMPSPVFGAVINTVHTVNTPQQCQVTTSGLMQQCQNIQAILQQRLATEQHQQAMGQHANTSTPYHMSAGCMSLNGLNHGLFRGSISRRASSVGAAPDFSQSHLISTQTPAVNGNHERGSFQDMNEQHARTTSNLSPFNENVVIQHHVQINPNQRELRDQPRLSVGVSSPNITAIRSQDPRSPVISAQLLAFLEHQRTSCSAQGQGGRHDSLDSNQGNDDYDIQHSYGNDPRYKIQVLPSSAERHHGNQSNHQIFKKIETETIRGRRRRNMGDKTRKSGLLQPLHSDKCGEDSVSASIPLPPSNPVSDNDENDNDV